MADEKRGNVSAPFLDSLSDTADIIEGLRAELATIERDRAVLDAKANELNGRISGFNALRGAHGLPAV